MANNNMELWNAVARTDPAHTKKVNQRGGFTAIDAHYQVQQATQAFGPVGIGWGYECGAPIFPAVDLIIIPVTLWHGDRSNTFGPQYGCAKFPADRVDPDAPKKATTDALTKLLSHLGFNADVFLGKFDDNKYVQESAAHFAAQADPYKAEADTFIDKMKATKTVAALDKLLKDNKELTDKLKRTSPALVRLITTEYAKHKASL